MRHDPAVTSRMPVMSIGRFDLRLVVAAAVIVVAAMIVAFVTLLEEVLKSTGLASSDLRVVRDLVADRNPPLLALMKVVTSLGSPLAMIGLAAVVCGGLAWRLRRSEPVVLGVAGIGGTELLDVTTKHVVARPRPPIPLHAVAASGYSFPSGHAIFSTLVILLCTAMVSTWLVGSPRIRAALWVGALIMIVAVGFSRVFLGVHYPSDILAGWSLAVAWLTVLLLASVLWPDFRR
jgi:undecaprenyl-diphosphatase